MELLRIRNSCHRSDQVVIEEHNGEYDERMKQNFLFMRFQLVEHVAERCHIVKSLCGVLLVQEFLFLQCPAQTNQL